jgi:lipid-binding SYLF domain-containing protein
VVGAISTLDTMMANPRETIPKEILREAQGVVIVPHMVKAGLIVGARIGRGVLLVRDSHGHWSNPLFVTVGGGSFGFQGGLESSEVLLVFRNRRSLDRFLKGKGQLTLGGDVGAAIGPLGRELAGETNLKMNAEILTYAHSRGLFAGVSLQGAVIKMDWNANFAYYGDFIPPEVLLNGEAVRVPEPAFRLWEHMTAFSGAVVEAPAVEVITEEVTIEPSIRTRIVPAPPSGGFEGTEIDPPAFSVDPTSRTRFQRSPTSEPASRPIESSAETGSRSRSRTVAVPDLEPLHEPGAPSIPAPAVSPASSVPRISTRTVTQPGSTAPRTVPPASPRSNGPTPVNPPPRPRAPELPPL